MGEAQRRRHLLPHGQDDPHEGSKLLSLPTLPGGLRSHIRQG